VPLNAANEDGSLWSPYCAEEAGSEIEAAAVAPMQQLLGIQLDRHYAANAVMTRNAKRSLWLSLTQRDALTHGLRFGLATGSGGIGGRGGRCAAPFRLRARRVGRVYALGRAREQTVTPAVPITKPLVCECYQNIEVFTHAPERRRRVQVVSAQYFRQNGDVAFR
jgi:hypothetical protein